MLNKLAINTITATVLTFYSFGLHAAEVCKVSMMGRVCFEEGSPEATAAHMKENAVAEKATKKKVADKQPTEDSNPKKVADRK